MREGNTIGIPTRIFHLLDLTLCHIHSPHGPLLSDSAQDEKDPPVQQEDAGVEPN